MPGCWCDRKVPIGPFKFSWGGEATVGPSFGRLGLPIWVVGSLGWLGYLGVVKQRLAPGVVRRRVVGMVRFRVVKAKVVLLPLCWLIAVDLGLSKATKGGFCLAP